MLEISSKALMAEIRDCENVRKAHLEMWADVVRRMCGNHYRAGTETEPTPENYPFGYLSFVLPQISGQQPEAEIEAVRDVGDEEVADALELAVEHWMRETGYKAVSKELIRDAIIGWGVSKVGLEPRGDYNGGGLPAVEGDFELIPLYPYRKRISPKDYFQDKPGTLSRIRGHSYERDVEDLQADERFPAELTAQLTGIDTENERREGEPFPETSKQKEAQRKRIKLYEVYLPEHGTIVTLAETAAQDGLILRQEPYYGPAEGPYTLWGLYSVPDQVYPLSPLVACWEQFLELQDHSTSAAREAGTHKRIGVFTPGAKKDAERIKNAPSGSMVPVSDPGGVKDFEIGGVSPGRVEYVGLLRDRLDRNLGFSDAQRGKATGKATLGENQLAQDNSDLRIAWLRDQCEDVAAAELRKVCWYYIKEREIKFGMVVRDPVSGARTTATFQGGPWEGGYVQNQWVPPQREDMDPGDFSLDIKVGSMAKQNDALAQKRAQDEWQLAMGMSQMGFPINWRRVLRRYGRAFGERDYDRILIMDDAGMMMPFGPGASAPGTVPQFGPQIPSVGQVASGMGVGMQRPASPIGASPNQGLTSMPGLMRNAMAV